jgi:hypothetical protein
MVLVLRLCGAIKKPAQTEDARSADEPSSRQIPIHFLIPRNV